MTVRCAHCLAPVRGVASLTRAGREYPLCHPDDPAGVDCFVLVTVYGHQVEGCPCIPVPAIPAFLDDAVPCPACGVLGDPQRPGDVSWCLNPRCRVRGYDSRPGGPGGMTGR